MQKKILRNKAIFDKFYQVNPNPNTELVYHSPFELLVAVMLSAQATDKLVNKVTEKLFAVANTPQAVLALGQTQLESYIHSVNYYRTKAKNILKTCVLLLDKHHGNIPNNRRDLEFLAGVGRKTANVILNVVFKQPEVAVDTHIFRVSNRTGLALGASPMIVEKQLLKVIPKHYQQQAHHWLVLHGRYVCKAKKPLCESCLIQEFCDKRL